MIASDSQLERIYDLIERFAKMRGRTMTEVTLALLNSKTIERLGYTGSGHLTERQADAAIGILEGWIERASALEDGKELIAMSFNARQTKYKGWTLVEVGRNYYCACKGSVRTAVGSIMHGDREDLFGRFKAKVDELEGVGHGTQD